jgi:mono/diheme cytochrome c family protein
MQKTWFLMIIGIGLGACVQSREPSADLPDGKRLFAENCVACHGRKGQGDGKMAQHLFMLPADLTALSANNGGVFPRNYVVSTMDGFARGEHFSGAMPEFGDKLKGRMVIMQTGEGVGTPTPAPLVALADYLESIQVK